jgi:DNA-directed RNA polymerase I subunit RPA1
VKLTFAEPVNDLNLSRMRQLVLNGAFKHPGACKVQKESGELIDLAMCSAGRLQQLSRSLVSSKGQAPMRVWRHLRDGDYVMVNRQPTLHRPSIMAHKVKVLKKQKTIRMHYANCNSYNADFDGDEINVHFPQDMVSQVEAKMVASTNHNYIVPTSSSPLRGLIQDHVAAGVYLTKVDTFFTRDRYQQLVYCCLGTMHLGRAVKILPPSIIKPTQLWSGKQLISTIIYNLLPPDRFEPLNIKSEAKVKGSYWGQHSEEGEVIIRGGELLVGILDKSQFGASQLGLVHCIFEAYGPVHAGEMLTVLGRLFTHFLQLRGFTCSIHDLVLSGARGVRVRVTRVCMGFAGRACVRVFVPASHDAQRAQILSKVDASVATACAEFAGVSWTGASDDSALRLAIQKKLRTDKASGAGLDTTATACLSKTTSTVTALCLPNGQMRPFPVNNFAMMTVSGAKGSQVNFAQIACLLGQQSLEGRRVANMASGKTLPSFLPFETSARANGSVSSAPDPSLCGALYGALYGATPLRTCVASGSLVG